MIVNIITKQKIKYNYSTELKVFRSIYEFLWGVFSLFCFVIVSFKQILIAIKKKHTQFAILTTVKYTV